MTFATNFIPRLKQKIDAFTRSKARATPKEAECPARANGADLKNLIQQLDSSL